MAESLIGASIKYDAHLSNLCMTVQTSIAAKTRREATSGVHLCCGLCLLGTCALRFSPVTSYSGESVDIGYMPRGTNGALRHGILYSAKSGGDYPTSA